MEARKKLRFKIIILLFSFGIIPLVVSVFFTYKIVSAEFAEHVQEELTEIESKISRRLETLIFFRWNDTILYSKLPLIKDEADNKNKSVFFKEVLKQYYPFAWLGLTDENGIIIASSHDESRGINAGSSDWFKKGKEADSVYVKEPYNSDISEGIPVISFSAPVYSSTGRFRGVLHTEVKMDAVAEDIKNIRIGKSGSVILVRGDGIVIADKKGALSELLTNVGALKAFQRAKKGEKGIIREIDHNGIDSFISYLPLKGLISAPGFELYLFGIQSVRDVYSTSNRIVYIVFIIVAIEIIVIAFGSFFIAGGITYPIENIVEAVKAVASGDLSKSVKVPARGEIGTLVDSINQMISAIRQRDAELQTKNRDLTRLNEKLEMANIELRKTQSQLLRSGRLAAVGELSAMVAEELNKPIEDILNNTQIVIKKIQEVSRALPPGLAGCEGYIKAIETASITCKVMAGNLLRFSRQEESELQPVNIRELIEEAMGFIDYKTSSTKIKIVKEVEPSLPKIQANPLQLVQALINIMLNAVEAMGNEGVLSIKGRNDNGVIRITISDTGVGIPKGDMGRIFEPLFTTKDRQSDPGLGLGLTIAHSIIKGHNGMITVESSSRGSDFIIELPVKNPV